MQHKDLDAAPQRGCLPTIVASVALFILSPVVAVIRYVQRRRRGSAITTSLSKDLETGLIELRVDAPTQRGFEARRELTEHIVRVAESLSDTSISYHLAYREPHADSMALVSIGPQLQALGDRLQQGLGRSAWFNMNLVWLALPSTQPLGSVFDPANDDPKNEEAIWSTIRDARAVWAAMTTTRLTGVAELMHVRILTQPDNRTEVEHELRKL
jgi:hypothetical protein